MFTLPTDHIVPPLAVASSSPTRRSAIHYWLPKTDRVWWWGKEDMTPEKTRPDFLRWHYAAAAGYERSILGGFWWGYIPEMASRNALWYSARQLFQEINR
jgi:hypothetical protein